MLVSFIVCRSRLERKFETEDSVSPCGGKCFRCFDVSVRVGLFLSHTPSELFGLSLVLLVPKKRDSTGLDHGTETFPSESTTDKGSTVTFVSSTSLYDMVRA